MPPPNGSFDTDETLDPITVVIARSDRLDKALAEHLPHSRNQIEKMIRAGQVRVGDTVVTRPSYRVAEGERVVCRPKRPTRRRRGEVDFDIPILYEDESILVLNKPAGVVVHPAPSVSDPTVVDWLVSRGVSLSTLAGEERHGIVHRLDKNTTGALVVAKTNAAHRHLSEQLQTKSMGRYYLAVIDRPLKRSRVVEAPIARHPKNRLKMAVVEGGRSARTHFVQVSTARQHAATLVAAKLFTGRTHQIRVHLGALGRHILGDDLYGLKTKEGKIKRIYLHAYLLYLTHPTNGDKLEIVAPLFEDMHAYLDSHFEKEILDEALTPSALRRRFDDDVFD
jgi:23S rRNA pseudouridine1911/1915/1917 synthase